MFLDAVSAPLGGCDKASEEGEGLIYHLSISATGNPDSGSWRKPHFEHSGF